MSNVEDIKKYLATPKDISQEDNEEKATIIGLYFIGYIAKPTGISDELLKKCVDAFNANRGKCEQEVEAILKILENEK